VTAAWQKHDPGTESLILAGPVLSSPFSPSAELKDVPVVAIDGGIRFAKTAFLWAGDGDSGSAPSHIPAMRKKNQDVTDLRFCLNGIRDWHWRDLHLFGFVGERRDHELANFGEIHAEMKHRCKFARGVFYGQDLRVLAVFYPEGEHLFTHEGLFSVLAFEPVEISLAGKCKYPTENLALTPLSGAGISNEGAGAIELRAGGPVAIFFPHG
jgi:thiamine pyrophosphokinase